MTAQLLHCLACDDVRPITAERTFCACQRSSARRRGDAVVLIGPATVVDTEREALDVIRPDVAIVM
jgi:hypothetical protein